MQEAVTLNNISKEYRIPSIFPWKKSKIIEALKQVTFACPESKITCLLGPNGAGKTTIIKILSGLIIPDSGEVKFFNKSFSGKSDKPDLRIGFVTQNERSFYWRLTGRQNLDFYGSLYNLKGKNKKLKIDEVLSEVNMHEESDKPFRLYSTGMRQKINIARALLCDPDLLLLDEPTTHLDPLAQESIHKLIKNVILNKRKTTILICTHNLYEAQILSDKIILLDKGCILAKGPISSLRSMIDSSQKIIIDFKKLPEKGWEKNLSVKIHKQTDSVIEITFKNNRSIPGIIKAAIEKKGEIIECRRTEESLFEIFSRLTKGSES